MPKARMKTGVYFECTLNGALGGTLTGFYLQGIGIIVSLRGDIQCERIVRVILSVVCRQGVRS